MLKEVRAGAARFTGARRVSNSFSSSENFTTSEFSTLRCSVAIDSTVEGPLPTINKIVEDNTTNSHLIISSGKWLVNRAMTASCYVKKGTALKVYIGSTTSAIGCFFNLDTGSVEGTIGSASCSILSIGDGWYRIYVTITPPVTGTFAFGIYKTFNAVWNTATNYTGSSEFVYATGLQIEDVTGQADQSASEYVHSGRDNTNYLTYTDDFASSAWINTNITITKNAIANPIDGRVNATKVEASATASGTACRATTAGIAVSTGMTACIYAKKGSGANHANIFNLYNLTSGSTIIYASLNYDTGFVTGVGATATDLGNGWWFVVLSSATGFSTGDVVRLFVGYPSISANAGEHAYFYGPTIMRGVVATPSYTPVGAAYDPHGSGVDGVKYFNTNKDGTPIASGYLKGYLNEGARTNNLLWCRDLTNAAWVKTTMTTALTSTGIDGQASASTLLTATAGNATCLQTFTMASAARTFSAYVKRITGTGTVNITRDNGTSWTDITALLSTSAYTRVNILGTSVTNPTCGFRIVTNGDAIDVDYCQDESDSFATNPISTTTVAVTRNSDLLYYYSANNISFTAGSALCNFSTEDAGSLTSRQMTTLATETNGKIIYSNPGDSHGLIRTYDGTNVLSSLGTFRNDRILKKATVSWSGTTLTNISEGSLSVSSGAFNGTMGSGSYLYIGTFSTATGSVLFGNIKDVYIWSNALTNNQMRQIVA
ncbi:MAG: hypothetical protein JNK54_01690 [Elusimicrobia bacterium]|nr:hypothetical protein [Elusimicrobiota bacterium]